MISWSCSQGVGGNGDWSTMSTSPSSIGDSETGLFSQMQKQMRPDKKDWQRAYTWACAMMPKYAKSSAVFLDPNQNHCSVQPSPKSFRGCLLQHSGCIMWVSCHCGYCERKDVTIGWKVVESKPFNNKQSSNYNSPHRNPSIKLPEPGPQTNISSHKLVCHHG